MFKRCFSKIMKQTNANDKKPTHNHSGHRQRMYQKLPFLEYMSDHEILEIYLYACRARVDTNDMAHRLLQAFGCVNGVLSASVDELCLVDGIGPETAAHIAVSNELLRRKEIEGNLNKRLLTGKEIKDFVKSRFSENDGEVLEVYFIDKAHKLKYLKRYSDYCVDKVGVPPDDFLKRLTIVKPHAVIFAHNHPSGICRPSVSDDSALVKCYQIVKNNGVILADNLIYGKDDVFSYCFGTEFEVNGVKIFNKERI